LTYLDKLKRLLDREKKGYYFFCIRDLVENGLELERFPENDSIPKRQDITQFLTSWCKYVGMSAQECRDWMLEYCSEMLSILSSSSSSQIRHSTKSNIKYIYNSNVTFECRCEENPFRAQCDYTCPVYQKMRGLLEKRKRQETEKRLILENQLSENAKPEEPCKITLKESYREQFENALSFAREQLEQGYIRREIACFLNEQGFKTRTGKEWTQSILSNELLWWKKQNK